MADLVGGGRRPVFFDFMQFFGQFCKIACWRLLEDWCTSVDNPGSSSGHRGHHFHKEIS